MFWADKVAQELKNRKLPLEWVDDMKTPSGRIHVGSLRGVVIHDLIYKALQEQGQKALYTYCINDMDPMDSFPVYLDKDKFLKFMGSPLCKIPSPQPGFASFSEYYAKDFIDVFNKIACFPKIVWTSELYAEGKFDELIKICLDNTDKIRLLFKEQYDNFKEKDYFPYQPICPSCGKIATTKISNWDGEYVYFECKENNVDYTKGCNYKGKIIPEKQNGKMPWKIEWGSHWKTLGVTIEWSGKDHMTKGGSHEIASKIAEIIFQYQTPYAKSYEHILIGGKKMSSSKGLGSSAREISEILPPEILRFLMVKTRYNQAINFDPQGDTIPNLFDDYQRCAQAYFEKGDPDLARIFELSQIGEVKRPPAVRFSILAQWVQMPNMQDTIEKEGLVEWAKYAKIWLDKYAPESEKFTVQKELPETAKKLSVKQKEFLSKVAQELDKERSAEDFQKNIYEWAKELQLSSKEAFAAIYYSLLGKDHGPKAGWLILSLDKEFVKKRFGEAHSNDTYHQSEGNNVQILNKPEVFSINKEVAQKFPSVSVGVAVIKGVTIEKSNNNLEKEKAEVLSLLEGLTTEQFSQYPEIVSYRKLYKETGIDWHSRRPSPEALLRRAALKKGLYTINTCVDAYNLVVMKHKVSVGSFDFDKIVFPTVLRFAKDNEEILLLGDSEPTAYKEGEIAYFDQNGGFNIDFNYRDAQRTAVQLTTKNVYINVDGIFDITPQKVEVVLKEACNTIIKYCGGTLEVFGVETAF